MRILIAEDDWTCRTILSATLEKWGYEPVIVTDGLAAWEILRQTDPPRLALLDWNMPGLNGPELCQRVRCCDTSDPPYLILLTVREDKGSVVEGLEAGANDYVTKPYDNDELHARIKVGLRVLALQAHLNAAKEVLTREAMYDPLTGVLNRRAIIRVLENEMARAGRNSMPLCLGILDIDHFKQINDSRGHLVGDEVLSGLTGILRAQLRPYDHLGRYGGEEFLLVVPGCGPHEAEQVYDRLRKIVGDSPIPAKPCTISLTVSIGVAFFEGNGAIDTLLASADAALYAAKRNGRNRISFAGR